MRTKKIFLIIIVIVLTGGFGYYYFLKVGSKNNTSILGCSASPEGLPWVAKIFGRVAFANTVQLSPEFITKSRLCFIKNPKLNEPVELVFEFKRGDNTSSEGLVSATATIQIPEGFEIVSGSLTWTGNLAEGKTEKMSLVVKPKKLGYYRFKSSVVVGTFTGSESILWVEVAPQGSIIGSAPQSMWAKITEGPGEGPNRYLFKESKDDNIFRFRTGNFGKGHDTQITSSLVLSNPLEFGKETLLIYTVTPKIDLPEKTQISLQFPATAFDVIDIGNSPNEKITQNSNTFIVWTGPLKKGQPTEVSVRLKVKNYGWGNISARIELQKDYVANRPPEESSTLVSDETILNLYLDTYGKSVLVLGDDLKSFNLSELHQIK